jgi:hypothetical protein
MFVVPFSSSSSFVPPFHYHSPFWNSVFPICFFFVFEPGAHTRAALNPLETRNKLSRRPSPCSRSDERERESAVLRSYPSVRMKNNQEEAHLLLLVKDTEGLQRDVWRNSKKKKNKKKRYLPGLSSWGPAVVGSRSNLEAVLVKKGSSPPLPFTPRWIAAASGKSRRKK